MSASVPNRKDLENKILLTMTHGEWYDVSVFDAIPGVNTDDAIATLKQQGYIEVLSSRYTLTYEGLREQMRRKTDRKKQFRQPKGS